MSTVSEILRTIQELSPGEQRQLRDALDAKLRSQADAGASGPSRSTLIGLFEGQDALWDEMMEEIYEQRNRPWRIE